MTASLDPSSDVSTAARQPRRAAPLSTAEAAGLCGFLAALPWLDPRLFPATWLGMTLWIAITVGQPAPAAFRLWLLGGLAFLATPLHWLPAVAADHLDVSLFTGALVAILVIGCDAFRFGVCGYLVARIDPRGAWGTLVWPVVWVALEWAWPHLFPWRMGQSQIGWLAVCQIAEVTGVYGVSFLLMWVAAAVAQAIVAFRSAKAAHCRLSLHESSATFAERKATLAPLLALAAVWGWGHWRINMIQAEASDQPQLRLALVQPGSRGDEMGAVLRRLSLQVHNQADVIVWGEGCLGKYSTAVRRFQDLDSRNNLDCALLAGGASLAPGREVTGPFQNTAFLIGADRTILGRYHKRALMPWGEYAVGQQWIPGLRGVLGGVEEYVAGRSAAPLALPLCGPRRRARLGVLICYEDLLASPTRQTVLEGADVLVNLNNLAVFGRTAAATQHPRMARFRAIENRRWLARCGTTGGTAVISATGRIEQQAPAHQPATLLAAVPLSDRLTFYTRYGDFFALLCAAAGALPLARRWFAPSGCSREIRMGRVEKILRVFAGAAGVACDKRHNGFTHAGVIAVVLDDQGRPNLVARVVKGKSTITTSPRFMGVSCTADSFRARDPGHRLRP